MRKFMLFLIVFALFPASLSFAQEPPTISAGCAALDGASTTANPSFTFGANDFLAGETITVTVSGMGTTFSLLEDGTPVGTPNPSPIGGTITYEVAADGNFVYR